MDKKLIIANWKMNGDLPLIKDYGALFKDLDSPYDVVVCPPSLYLWSTIGAGYIVGAQDCHFEKTGAFTGCISAEMLKQLGVKYVIIGHSERRAQHNETDILICNKAKAAIDAGLIPIICVGETAEEKDAGRSFEILKGQIKSSVPKENNALIIAYEPVWAIGSGRVAKPDEITKAHEFIKTFLPYNKVIYGGSVKSTNAHAILNMAFVDGILVGGASLDMNDFKKIVSSLD